MPPPSPPLPPPPFRKREEIFPPSTFIDGVWIKDKKKEKIPDWFQDHPEPKLAQPPTAPKLALLTHTVVQSPVYHWTVPLTPDGGSYSDIAFVGDHSIRIKRLDTTGNLRTIWELHNIRTRIRNAAALRPKQTLYLALEDGNFLVVRPELAPCFGGTKRVVDLWDYSKDALGEPTDARHYPGSVIATDPTSRYIAIACAENEVDIMDTKGRYLTNLQDSMGLKGVILMMDFLPSPGDLDLVLLVVLVSTNGEFRIHLFQWEAGKKPWKVRRHHGESGFQLRSVQVPQLLIPLSQAGPAAFLLVFERATCLCTGLLGTDFVATWSDLPNIAPMEAHRSLCKPIWVSWFQTPMGVPSFYAIIREDGVVTRIESSGEAIAGRSSAVLTGTVSCATTITLRDTRKSTDKNTYVVYGTESGPGRVILLKGKHDSGNEASILPNWAPLNDFHYTSSRQESPLNSPITRPDNIYGCSGMGTEGFVHELSRKVEASVCFSVGVEAFKDTNESINGTWDVPQCIKVKCTSGVCDAMPPDILISLNDRSVVLKHGERDELSAISEDHPWLDLSSKTFAAFFGKTVTFQLTANKLMVAKMVDGKVVAAGSYMESDSQDSPWGPHGGKILDAATDGKLLLIYTESPNGARTIHWYCFKSAGDFILPEFIRMLTVAQNAYPTCLALARIGDTVMFARGCLAAPNRGNAAWSRGATERLLVGMSISGQSATRRYMPMDGEPGLQYRLHSALLTLSEDLEARRCVSIGFLAFHNEPRTCLVLTGHTDGVLSGRCSTHAGTHLQHTADKSFNKRLGISEVHVCVDTRNPTRALVSCGRDMYLLSYHWTSELPQLTKVDISIPKNHIPSIRPPITLISNYNKGFLLSTSTHVIYIELGSQSTGFLPINSTAQLLPPNILPGPATTMLAFADLGRLVLAGTRLDKTGLVAGPALYSCWVDGSLASSLVGFDSRNTSAKFKHEEISCMIEFKKPRPWVHGTTPLVLAGTSRGVLALLVCPLDRLRADRRDICNLAYKQMGGPIHCMLQSPLDSWCAYICAGQKVVFLKFAPVGCLFENLRAENPLPSDDDTDRDLHYGTWTHKEQQTIDLPSRGVAIGFMKQDNREFHQLTVLTAVHGLITFAVSKSGDAEEGKIDDATTIVDDKKARNGFDMHSLPTPEEGGQLIFVSDKDCGVTALWKNDTPHAPKTTLDYETIFGAGLPVSIKKFRLVDVGRMWDSDVRFDEFLENHTLAHPSSDPSLRKKLLGISNNGSVIQFTIIKPELFSFITMLEHFAAQVPGMCAIPRPENHSGMSEADRDRAFYFTPPPSSSNSMHNDGDLIKEWLKHRCLARFLIHAQMKTPYKLCMKLMIFLKTLKRLRPEWLVRNDFENMELKAVSLAENGWHSDDTEVLMDLVWKVYTDVLEPLFRPVD